MSRGLQTVKTALAGALPQSSNLSSDVFEHKKLRKLSYVRAKILPEPEQRRRLRVIFCFFGVAAPVG